MFYFFAILAVTAAAVNADPIRLSSRIIGGENATIQSHPYVVNIQIRRHKPGAPNDPVCGGAIISSHYVVTGNYCIANSIFGYEQVIRAGSSNAYEGGSIHELDWYKGHDKFDLALIRVKQPFHFDDSRQPIELMDQDAKPGSMAEVTGWGRARESTLVGSKWLQAVSVPIVDKKVCQEVLKKDLPEYVICAGYVGQSGKNFCLGDTGGPMVVDDKLVGIISWSKGCFKGPHDDLGVYTEVARVRDWIVKYAEL